MALSKLPHSTFRRTILPNGMTLLVQPLHHFASVSVGLSVNVGSRHETVAEAGISHVVEHMLFQGTVRRDTRELSRVISAVGGTHDACTGRESTAFYAKVPVHYFSLAMDVLADMVNHSRFSPAHLRKEKQIILEEIRMYEDAPDEYVHDLLFEAFWPQHPMGRPILGNHKSLLRLERKDLLRFVHQYYSPKRMILSVAGNVTAAQAEKEALRYFGAMHSPKVEPPQPPAAPIPFLGEQIKTRDLEQAHVCLGVHGLAFSDPRRLCALALSNVLGSGTNSRLFYEVREKRALVYAIYSFMDFYHDTGLGGIYFACHPKKVSETLVIIQRELARLADQPISDQELIDLREQMRGYYLISLESSSTHMWNMIQQEMYLQKHPAHTEILQAIGKIKKSDIQKLAQALFVQVPVAKAIIGPVSASVRKQVHDFKVTI